MKTKYYTGPHYLTSVSYFEYSYWNPEKRLFIYNPNHSLVVKLTAGISSIMCKNEIVIHPLQSKTICLVKHGYERSLWSAREIND